MNNKLQGKPIHFQGEVYDRDTDGRWYIRTVPAQHDQTLQYIWRPIHIARVPLEVKTGQIKPEK